MHWEHFEHDADIGIRGIAPTLSQAFAEAAIAMTAVITNPERIATTHSFAIHCSAADNDILFLDWINELIYAMAVHKLLFRHYQVDIMEGRLSAIAYGEPIDHRKHQPAVEIKGATFTELYVGQRSDGQWVAQCIVDV